VVGVQLPVLLLHALPDFIGQTILHGERDELCRVAQIRQLHCDELAIYHVEECVVAAEAVEV